MPFQDASAYYVYKDASVPRGYRVSLVDRQDALRLGGDVMHYKRYYLNSTGANEYVSIQSLCMLV